MPEQKTCFVVMGFNKKTDYATGRTLDLDKTYRTIIKPAVEAAQVKCVRADEIVHSGVIDVPMYEQLLDADVVVADISTMNPNALYELGVRHALRPFTTIVIGESRIAEKSYPFDLSHLLIRSYVHLGDGIDYEEVERARKELTGAITTILKDPKHDSPVYVHLAGLEGPKRAGPRGAGAVAMAAPAAAGDDGAQSHSVMLAAGETALQEGDFATAAVCYGAAHRLRPNDTYLVQRGALATYKSKLPTPLEAARAARHQLEALEPEISNDGETLGLWGAVHKRLFELTGDRGALDAAVFAHEKSFYLKNDYYNGINLAFLLNVRATLGEPADAIADFVDAGRVRARVASVCLRRREHLAKRIRDIELALSEGRLAGPELAALKREVAELRDERYWVLATLAEALAGDARQKTVLDEANALDVAPWMKDSTKEQLTRLEALLADSPLKHLAKGGG